MSDKQHVFEVRLKSGSTHHYSQEGITPQLSEKGLILNTRAHGVIAVYNTDEWKHARYVTPDATEGAASKQVPIRVR